MNKKILGSLILAQSLWALDVPIDEVQKRVFNESIRVNSQIIQLSSSKSLVMAQMGGKITKYLVKEGDKVKKGQRVALVSVVAPLELTINIEPLKAELKALRKSLKIANENYDIVAKLYKTGLESRQNLNIQKEEKNKIVSDIEVTKVKISTLVSGKKSANNTYSIYAGSTGMVDEILVASNAVVDANTPLLSIVKGKESFLAKSYVPLKYMNDIKVGLKGQIYYGGVYHNMMVTQVLPKLDTLTQQIQVLSSFSQPVKNLFVNTYVDSKLSVGEPKSYLAVKKSALSFFNNEWVVFVPKKHDEDKHDEHAGQGHESLSKDDAHAGHDHAAHEEESHEKDNHDEHEGHGHESHEEQKEHDNHGAHEQEGHDEKEEHKGHGHEEEEEEGPYGIKVVKIIKQNENWVAIEGLDEHEDYVSDRSYYVKSLLLKSSLGGHGH